MKALARAVINAALYLDLADEESLDPDLALQALEEIGYNLGYCTPEEKEALAQALAEMRAVELEEGPRPQVLEFLDTFMAAFGLEEGQPDDHDPEPPERMNLL